MPIRGARTVTALWTCALLETALVGSLTSVAADQAPASPSHVATVSAVAFRAAAGLPADSGSRRVIPGARRCITCAPGAYLDGN